MTNTASVGVAAAEPVFVDASEVASDVVGVADVAEVDVAEVALFVIVDELAVVVERLLVTVLDDERQALGVGVVLAVHDEPFAHVAVGRHQGGLGHGAHQRTYPGLEQVRGFVVAVTLPQFGGD